MGQHQVGVSAAVSELTLLETTAMQKNMESTNVKKVLVVITG